MTINAQEFIDDLGGPSVVASLVNVQQPSVSEWKQRGQIPTDKRILLAPIAEARFPEKYRRWSICPDTWWMVWPELINTKGAPAVPQKEAA